MKYKLKLKTKLTLKYTSNHANRGSMQILQANDFFEQVRLNCSLQKVINSI